MRIYEVYYSNMQANAKFKTLLPESAENFVVKYSSLPKMEYMILVLETCVHNFRSDILYSIAKMSRDAGDEALVSLYNGCIMLNPILDSDTWSNITYSYNVFNRKVSEQEPNLDLPQLYTQDDEELITEDVPTNAPKERKKRIQAIPYAKFANLDTHLNDKIIGQPEAIKQVVSALKRSQAHLNDPNRPLGIFFFAGPSGVGKTLIAKELQSYLFQGGDLVRVDCGEYQHKHENQKLIGCFTPEAKVMTDHGLIPIDEVNVRMNVLTHEGDFKKVQVKHVMVTDDELIRIKTAGSTDDVFCTKNHEIYVIKNTDEHDIKNAKFVHAGNIELGDLLIRPIITPKKWTFKGFSFHPVVDVNYEHYKGRVYDLSIRERSTYTVSGFVVHNSPPGFIGHDEGGQLTRALMNNPQTVVLLDEAEKAHPDFWHTFLKPFDDGFMTDNKGNKVSFKDAIIILTSNLGNDKVSADTYGKKTGFTSNAQGYDSKINPKRDMVERQTKEAIRKSFKPEFLNRLDDIIVFNHLEPEDYAKIAELEFQYLCEKLSKQQFILEWDDKAVALLVDKSSRSIEGARSMAKVRREYIENKLADVLINRKHRKGTIFTVLTTPDDDFTIVWSK